jgi:MoaA/NifB/PqqE/SkfB family radical SAM enzyme
MSGAPPAEGWLRVKRRALDLAQPLSAHLELTYRCNWRCVFCFNPRHGDVRPLAVAEWTTVLDDLRELGTLALVLTGGEPLAHPDFLAIARAARARGFALRLFTNGSLVTDEMADLLAGLDLVGVEMSLHGATSEVHDGATQRAGSLDAMLKGLTRLRERGVPVLLKTPLTRLNEHELDAMVALTGSLGVPHVIDGNMTPRDDGDQGPLEYRASAEGIERMFRKVSELGRLPEAVRSAGGVNCGLGRLTVAVDPEGNVYPCLQWKKRALGNVRVTRLSELWRTSPVREQAADAARAANDVMLGQPEAVARFPFCPALAFERTGDPLVPDERHVLEAEIVHRLRPPA